MKEKLYLLTQTDIEALIDGFRKWDGDLALCALPEGAFVTTQTEIAKAIYKTYNSNNVDWTVSDTLDLLVGSDEALKSSERKVIYDAELERRLKEYVR